MTRILHTSDWHLGRVLHEHSLLDDQRHFLAQLTEILRTDAHDVLVIAGDVFDRSVPPEEAVDLLTSSLRDLRAACPTLPIVLIAGNHDSASRLAYAAPLLEAAGLHVRGGASRIEEPVVVRGADGDEAEVWPVPFLWPGALSEHQDGAELRLSTQTAALEEAMRRIAARRSTTRAQVLVAHCFASGGSVSESERTLVGTATQVDTSIFAGFDYVALGHLHRPQRVTTRAWYSGSPLKYSFSEVSDVKCVLSVQVTRGAEPQVREVPIAPLREMAIVRGSFDRLRTDPEFASYVNHYLRVELEVAEAVVQPVPVLRKRFPHLLEFRVPRSGDDVALERGALSAGDTRKRADIGADFMDFERHLRGGAEAPAHVQDAFRALRERAEKEVLS
jgi:exonuclease SbcD